MRIKSLIHSIAGTTKIIPEGIFVEVGSKALVVKARPAKREQCRCGICHKRASGYDCGRETRRWRCLNVGAEMTYIESSLPRVRCKEHGVVSAAVPWARHKSRFCKNFEETVAWLSTHASKRAVSELMRIEWHTVGNICKRVYKGLEQAAANRFDGLVNIGIDETSYKKGHKYMTVVINHDTAAVVWCGIGYVLLKNPENLSENQQAQLEFLTQANPRLYRAYLLKEGLRLALKVGADEIEYALNKWMGWAQRCRIPGFRELRLKIKRNFVAIVASAKHGLSNARMEATNNKIKLGIRTAFGFRNPDSLIAMVMLTCSDIQPKLPRL